jgi:hypothetical protein
LQLIKVIKPVMGKGEYMSRKARCAAKTLGVENP